MFKPVILRKTLPELIDELNRLSRNTNIKGDCTVPLTTLRDIYSKLIEIDNIYNGIHPTRK